MPAHTVSTKGEIDAFLYQTGFPVQPRARCRPRTAAIATAVLAYHAGFSCWRHATARRRLRAHPSFAGAGLPRRSFAPVIAASCWKIMLSIACKVERIVAESPFLMEGLGRGLINLSELARQLQPQLETDLWKPVGQAAVVMALRRLAERLPTHKNNDIVLAQRTGELTTRTGLTEFIFRYSDHTCGCHRQLLENAASQRGVFVTVTRGVNEVMVICGRPLTAVVEEVFAGERQLARLENLNAVTLHLDADTYRSPGIFHAILKKLAWEKINLVNMICTYSELTLLLEDSQTAPAFALLSQIVGH
jgi:hypothetical protein